jgi:spore maturation protein CgeB
MRITMFYHSLLPDWLFLEPGREVLVARDGDEVARHLAALDPACARTLGDAARRRILAEHTYRHRAAQVENVVAEHIGGAMAKTFAVTAAAEGVEA